MVTQRKNRAKRECTFLEHVESLLQEIRSEMYSMKVAVNQLCDDKVFHLLPPPAPPCIDTYSRKHLLEFRDGLDWQTECNLPKTKCLYSLEVARSCDQLPPGDQSAENKDRENPSPIVLCLESLIMPSGDLTQGGNQVGLVTTPTTSSYPIVPALQFVDMAVSKQLDCANELIARQNDTISLLCNAFKNQSEISPAKSACAREENSKNLENLVSKTEISDPTLLSESSDGHVDSNFRENLAVNGAVFAGAIPQPAMPNKEQMPEKNALVPQVLFQEIVRHVPHQVTGKNTKQVPVHQVHTMEKILEVPQVQIAKEIVEEPNAQHFERVVPVQQVSVKEQTVSIPELGVQNVNVPVPKAMAQEVVEIPQMQISEQIVGNRFLPRGWGASCNCSRCISPNILLQLYFRDPPEDFESRYTYSIDPAFQSTEAFKMLTLPNDDDFEN